MRSSATTLLLLAFFSVILIGNVQSIPVDEQIVPHKAHRGSLSAPTPAPRAPLNAQSTPDEVLAFYAEPDIIVPDKRTLMQDRRQEMFAKRQESLSVQVSALPPPKFPAEVPSCPKCEAQYPSLSSCMSAASVFANSTSIFNNPIAYVDVIRCACTDTFQAVFPQCVDCFQATNQCVYLGTDPEGTGAGDLVSNVRNICGLGSALLGGVATANTHVGSSVPTNPGTYTDVTSTGVGYLNEATGAIFQSDASAVSFPTHIAAILLSMALAVAVGGARLFV